MVRSAHGLGRNYLHTDSIVVVGWLGVSRSRVGIPEISLHFYYTNILILVDLADYSAAR